MYTSVLTWLESRLLKSADVIGSILSRSGFQMRKLEENETDWRKFGSDVNVIKLFSPQLVGTLPVTKGQVALMNSDWTISNEKRPMVEATVLNCSRRSKYLPSSRVAFGRSMFSQ